MNPDTVQLMEMLQVLRQTFCAHKESYAYRKYDELVFVEFSKCANCGKTLGKFAGFDEDMRG